MFHANFTFKLLCNGKAMFCIIRVPLLYRLIYSVANFT